MPRDFPVFFEQWRSIPGYEGSYEVSNFGSIRSLERFARYKTTQRSVPDRFLKFRIGTHGYLIVDLYQNEKKKSFTVHKVVARVFLGPRPFGLFVHHVDHNKLNNYASNLDYVTFDENLKHRDLSRGENHFSAKLRDEDIPRIRLLATEGRSHPQIAETFGVNSATISDVIKQRTWKHII